MTNRPLATVGVVALCIILAGCAGEPASVDGTSPGGQAATPGQSSPAAGQGVSIDFRTEPDPPRAGDNTIEVDVRGPDGSPITDATVTAVFSMPAMPAMNMPAMRSTATLVHQASGRYRGVGQLSMGGTWNVNVTAARGPDEIGRRNLSLIAK